MLKRQKKFQKTFEVLKEEFLFLLIKKYRRYLKNFYIYSRKFLTRRMPEILEKDIVDAHEQARGTFKTIQASFDLNPSFFGT